MSYYAILSATSLLLTQHNLAMRRCMRRFNGPHRYVLLDMGRCAVHIDAEHKNRRMGYTLQELLEWLSRHPDPAVAAQALLLAQRLQAAQLQSA